MYILNDHLLRIFDYIHMHRQLFAIEETLIYYIHYK